MTLERHAFTVRSARPPRIEWDVDADAVYVRFSRKPVARTVDQNARKMTITVDLDTKNEVIGIEAVGMTRFSFGRLLEAARVSAPNVDFSEAQIEAT